MTRSRRSNCSHGDDAPAYPVRVERWYKPQNREAFEEALRRFASVLESLPGPFDGAIAELTARDIELMLRRMPVEQRTQALRPLGLRISPRSVGKALCYDVLNRLQRAHQHDAMHAASRLARQATATLAARTAEDHGKKGKLPTTQWPEQVLRFALWAGITASASDARMLQWAGTQPWWLPETLSKEHGKAVLAAAQAVVDTSPDFQFADATNTASAHPWDEHEAEEATVATAGSSGQATPAPGMDAAGLGPETADMDTGQEEPRSKPAAEESTAMPVAADTPADAETLGVARARRSELDSLLAQAIAAARRIQTALNSGAAAAVDDIAAVAAVREHLQALTQLVTSASARSLPEADALNVDAIDAAINALQAAAEHKMTSARLARLRNLRCVPNAAPALHAQVDAAITLINELLTAGSGEEVSGRADALLAIGELIDSVAATGASGADPQQLLELQTRATTGLPASLALLPVSALMGQLTWAPAAESAPILHPRQASHEKTPASPGQSNAGDQLEPAPVVGLQAESASAAITAPSPSVPEPARTDGQASSNGTLPDSAGTSVAKLISAGRFGLAEQIAAAAGWSEPRRATLRLAALAAAARTETGPSAARLRAELSAPDISDLTADTAMLPLATAALLRTALVVGEPTTGALLDAVRPRLEPHLAHVAEQVGRRALRGVLIGGPLRTVLADVTELETRLGNACEAAREQLRPRTLRFKRATDIANRWLNVDGLLGRLLNAAANDVRTSVSEVTSEVVRLSDRTELAKEIDRLDAALKGHSGKPVEGASRQHLFSLATDTLTPVSAWLEAVGALQRRAGAEQQTWVTTEITEMREAVRVHATDALAALADQSSRTDPLARAAAAAARDSLQVTFALLDSTTALPPGEVSADLALSVELLKIPNARVDPSVGLVTVPTGTPVEALLAAAGIDWRAAFDSQLAAENYPAADFLLLLAQSERLTSFGGDRTVISGDAEQTLTTAEHRTRTELAAIREQLLTELRRARLQNEVSEEQDGELTALLDAANPDGRRDLADLRIQLANVAELLPHYRDEAARRLLGRLETLTKQPGRVEVDDAHIRRLIDSGQLSTAEELIYFCEIGEAVPTARRRADLERFFPAVPDALPNGLTTDVIDAVRAGRFAAACDALDFGRLSPNARGFAADALDAWRLLGATPPERRTRVDERASLLPALRLVGLETTKLTRLDLHKGRERRFVELSDVTVNGKAMVPQFGSKLGGRLRVLLIWGQPGEDTVMSWVDHDTSGDSVLVAYFGTMSAATRRGLAARAVDSDAPVAVLDDAALAYLAAHGSGQLDATTAVTLPFSAVQPYVRHKRSLVAPEMFYGRDAERKAVLDPDGTQVIFGGRGLGKSALLRHAKAAFEREPGRVAIHIELTTVDIGPEKQTADAVWDVLLRDLESAHVVPNTKALRRGKKSHEIVRAGVLSWLEGDNRRRLLILLDESDGFFEADAPRFLETNRLKDLGLASEGRAKVVFAGLHSVQRFAKMSNNTFKHLAQRPTVIGPLPPQFAYNLIAWPLETLGYAFADDDLVNRILGYCSYQPFLLQMFGHRLVEHLQTKRTASVADNEPPFVITRADVEAVEADPELRADITGTFRDTLNLDPRYNVIANVLANHAHELGMDARLSDVDLHDECLAWWPAGFSKLDVEGSRAYLHEMVGLGVLAPNNDGRGWHLRSPNVLRMIGSKDDVIAELVHAASEAVPSEFIALSMRRLLPDGVTRSPLTAAQVDDILGDHANQVRLVLGSRATGIADVGPTLRAVCEELGNRYTLLDTRNRKAFEDALVDGRPGERRLVMSDLVALGAKEEACATSLEAALERRPLTRGVTRSVVAIAGPEQLGFWQETLAADTRPGLGLVTLRRYDRRTLKVWAFEAGYFGTDDRQTRLLEVTGGWPMLVERAVSLAAGLESEDAALEKLAGELTSADGAADFVDAVGLTTDEQLADAFNDVTQLVDESASYADLVAAAGYSGQHLTPNATVACLDALGVFNTDENGAYHLEPLIVRCWPYRRMPMSL